MNITLCQSGNQATDFRIHPGFHRVLLLTIFFVATLSWGYAQVPTISGIAPASGIVGSSVVISGSNFSATSANNIVFFGAVRASVTGASATSLTVTVPSGATEQPVSVTVNGATGRSQLPFLVTFSGGTVNASSLGSPVALTSGASPRAVAISDIDGDGKPDLIAVNNTSNTVSIYRNLSATGSITAASFATKVDLTTDAAPYGLAVGDIDGDGRGDIAVSTITNSTISVFKNISSTNTISFDPKIDVPSTTNVHSLTLCDLDADGKPELVAIGGANVLAVYRNLATTGTIDNATFPSATQFSVNSTPESVAAGDVDGNGKPDLVISTTGGTAISMMLNTTVTPGSYTFSKTNVGVTSPSTGNVILTDLDGDGKLDIALASGTGTTVHLLRNVSGIGLPDFETYFTITTSVANVSCVAAADFDGDGMTDLVLGSLSNKVQILRNVGGPGYLDGTSFAAAVEYTQSGTSTNYGLALGDLNGDSKPDVVTSDNANASVLVMQNGGPTLTPQTITFGALASQTFGSTFNLTATASSALTVSYSSDNTSVATISGNTVTVVGVGTAEITATQAGNATYSAATPVAQTLTTTKASQTITFGAIADKIIGDAAFNPGATTSSGLAVSYSSSNTSVATVSGSTVTIVGAGTTTITATQTGNANYSAATLKTQDFTVSKQTQTITFGAIAAKIVGDANFTLGATASSGLTVTYSSSNTGVATISGSTVTIVGAGTTTITASQAGNATFSAATAKTQDLVVSKQTQTITFGAIAAKIVGDANFTLGATASSGLTVSYSSSNTGVATVSGSTVTIVGAGTTTITATQAGNATFSAATAKTQDLVVTSKQAQTITFGAIAAKTVGDANFTLGATASSGLVVSYSSSNTGVATISGTTVTIVGAGTTTITATQAGNATFNAAPAKTQDLVVSKQTQTITFGAVAAKTVGDANFTLGATASSGLAVSYSSSNTGVATISGSTVTIVGAGTTTITATQAGNATFSAATAKTQDLVVSKKTQTITFAAIAAKTMGDAAFNPGATASSALAVSYSSSNTGVATISGSTVTIVGAGTTTITATQAGNATYSAATAKTQDLVVSKKNQTITFATLPTKTVGDANFTLGATASSALAVSYSSSNTAVATVTGNTVHIVAAGTTTITASQTGNATFNAATSVNQALNVLAAGGTQVSQTITFAELSQASVGDGPFTLSATASSGLAVTYTSSQPSVATISGSTVTIVGVGETQITASQPGNVVFKAATPVARTLVVLPVVATEYEAPGVVSIYPNPTADRVTIVASRFNQQSPVQVALIDTYGRIVVQEALRADSNNEVGFSISSLSDGVYIVHVTQGALEFRNRIVKTR